jgi:hypothetical protein
MSDNPTVSQQYAFSVGEDGDTDEIEPSEESVETDLEAFGANVDHRERDTRIAQPEASSFGIDDRATVTRSDGGEQQALFADTDDDQQTLTGERAASQCLFESHDAESDDDPDAVITASDEAPRATKPRERSPTAAKQSPKPTRNVLARRVEASITDLTDSFMTPQTSHGQTTTRFAASVLLRLHQTTWRPKHERRPRSYGRIGKRNCISLFVSGRSLPSQRVRKRTIMTSQTNS